MATGNRTVNKISGEEWRPVGDSCGWYSVSNMGRVRRNAVTAVGSDGRRLSFGEHLMGQQRDPDGYLQIKFSRLCPYPRKQPLVHRLVFEAFVRPIGATEEINHINATKADNRVENLEAVHHLANMQHAMARGLSPVGDRCGRAILTNTAAVEIVRLRRAGYGSTEVARMFGVSQPTVSNIMAGRNWHRITGVPARVQHSRRT